MTISEPLKKVSDAVILIHREIFEESPTPMKLQKLCYYAQGYSLVDSEGLFKEDFQAWQHGPVLVELYHKFKHYQWRQISEETLVVEEGLRELITEVVSAYGRYDGAALSTMTHRETPWLEARGDLEESDGSTELITKNSLRSFFKSKLASVDV